MSTASAYTRSRRLRHGAPVAAALALLVGGCARIDIPLVGNASVGTHGEAPRPAREGVPAAPLGYGAVPRTDAHLLRLAPAITAALENTSVGEVGYWRSEEIGLAGTVTPATGVALGPAACRPFRATAFVPNAAGHTLDLSGEACRSHGVWSLTRLAPASEDGADN